jgi:hypothetical protein
MALQDNSGNGLGYQQAGFGTGSVSYGSYFWQGFEHSFTAPYPFLTGQPQVDGSAIGSIFDPSTGNLLIFNQYLSYYEGVNPSHLPPYGGAPGGGGGEILI